MTKRIFISDIHMGDSRGIGSGEGVHPYCWFYDDSASGENRPEMLRGFLAEYCMNDPSVTEIVILGDLFDEWICPINLDPTDPSHPMPPRSQQIINIANAGQNRPAVEVLKQLAAQGRLKYVPGNHDLLTDKDVMEGIFPNIDYIDPNDGHAIYKKDGIWAEHGHWYGLFNSPYHGQPGDGFAGSLLPLGFFISRLCAWVTMTKGGSISPSKILKGWVDHLHNKVPGIKAGSGDHGMIDAILMQLFGAFVAEYAPDMKGTVLNGFGGIPGSVTWQQVTDRYANLFSGWDTARADHIGPYEAIICDGLNSLDPAASQVIFHHSDEAKIVIFGHTHVADTGSNIGVFDVAGRPPSETVNIYVNSGAWNNETKTCTFVESELDLDEKKHFVRLKKWVKQTDGTYGARDFLPDLYMRLP